MEEHWNLLAIGQHLPIILVIISLDLLNITPRLSVWYWLLKVLKRQGLSLEMLHNVFYAIIVSKIAYACLLYTSPSPRD